MIPAAIYVFALFATDPSIAQAPRNPDVTSRGSHESVAPPRHVPSSGLTLEMLHGLPPTRDAWFQPQPQVSVYQTYIGVYPYSYPYSYSYGLGGYRPPMTGGYYRPWASWWFR
ncbi:MAG: hypothetical protein J0I06_00185 [Planctomycetes bacterium]|nr:hypothetical protein [Planctomycetota bacterium]